MYVSFIVYVHVAHLNGESAHPHLKYTFSNHVLQGQKQSGFPGSGRDGGKKKQEVKIFILRVYTSYSMH